MHGVPIRFPFVMPLAPVDQIAEVVFLAAVKLHIQLPRAIRLALHHMRMAIPVVEIADDRSRCRLDRGRQHERDLTLTALRIVLLLYHYNSPTHLIRVNAITY